MMVRSFLDIILMEWLSAKLPSAQNLFDFLQIHKNLAQNTQTRAKFMLGALDIATCETALFSKWIEEHQKAKSYLNQSNQPLVHA